MNKDFKKAINSSIKVKKKLVSLEEKIHLAVKLIYETIKKIIKFLFVEMVDLRRMLSIWPQNFWLDLDQMLIDDLTL